MWPIDTLRAAGIVELTQRAEYLPDDPQGRCRTLGAAADSGSAETARPCGSATSPCRSLSRQRR